ncbi:MAG: deoxyribonuclease V [Planctomycetota bacterium]
MKIEKLHDWDLTPKEAIRLQARLSEKLVFTPPPRRPRLVAGADCAFTKDGGTVVAAVLVLSFPGLEVVERAVGRAPAVFPYVPGLLSFREAPALLDAFAKIESSPDVVMFDGQGLAHPRRLGLACHLGLWLDVATIGCAKSRLAGTSRGDPRPSRGSWRKLSIDGDEVGRVLRTRDGVKPLFVSPGHRADVAGAARIVLATGVGYRLPEPTRLADREVARLTKGA